MFSWTVSENVKNYSKGGVGKDGGLHTYKITTDRIIFNSVKPL